MKAARKIKDPEGRIFLAIMWMGTSNLYEQTDFLFFAIMAIVCAALHLIALFVTFEKPN